MARCARSFNHPKEYRDETLTASLPAASIRRLRPATVARGRSHREVPHSARARDGSWAGDWADRRAVGLDQERAPKNADEVPRSAVGYAGGDREDDATPSAVAR